jgi:L,D-peptidoglycan transpeptidase YkuD (ErfK/YbiS/YcfS/YnhG family)
VQVITVKAPSSTSRTAVLEAWQRPAAGGMYRRVYGPVTAYVGDAGVGTASETSTKTPAGVWRLTQAFGVYANPGSTLPYFAVDRYDWWVGDPASRYYNRRYRCAPGSCPFRESRSEHLIDFPVAYRYAVVMNYNTNPVVPGAGSAFFLHVTNYRPTAGCVAIPQASLVWLLRWLRPAYTPAISIAVGLKAYLPVWHRYA